MTRISSALLLATTVLTPALTLALAPTLAEARPVTLTAQLKSYGGPGAYIVAYLVDKSGAYQGSLWMAGGNARYYRHLSEWNRATKGDYAQVDGITGASVGSGRQLSVTVEVADALIDAGYQIRIDTAAENIGEAPRDVSVALTGAGAGKPVNGRGFIQTFQYDM